MTKIVVWGYALPREWLSQAESRYLEQLPAKLPSVEWVWTEMDRVWQSSHLDNTRPLAGQCIDAFYRHPVWLMNGIFTAVDPDSCAHRTAIAACLSQRGARTIADFGGGFGELAREIARRMPDAEVLIVEPFPTRVCSERCRDCVNISLVATLADVLCDAVVAQDVLEHVEDPIGLAIDLASALREGGVVVFANCFYPVIHCHLPSTFHLRHTFPWVMRALGLRYKGTVQGAAHAQVYERVGPLNLARARKAERLSRRVGGGLNAARAALSSFKRRIIRK